MHQCLDLLGQKIIKHAGGKENRAARCVDFGKPRRIIQIAGDIFLTLPGGQKLVAHGYDIGKVQIVNFASAVVAGSAGAVKSAAQIDHRRVRVVFQIVPHLKGEVVLSHGNFQRAETLHQAAGVFLRL